MNGTKKLSGGIKTTLSLVVFILFLDAIIDAIGTTTFWGGAFNIVKWISILLVIISILSDLGTIDWIMKIFK